MAQDIYVIDDDESSIPIFKELFRNDKEFKFIGVKTEHTAMMSGATSPQLRMHWGIPGTMPMTK